METASVSAVLFAKDLKKVAAFYAQALGMTCTRSDDQHVMLNCRGFELIVHQIPRHLADGIVIQQPPIRRAPASTQVAASAGSNDPCPAQECDRASHSSPRLG